MSIHSHSQLALADQFVQDQIAPRKRPVQQRSADTVAAIIEGAARILEERGMAGFTTNAVSERAGVSIGSLYQYFPGKDALLAALIERVQSEHTARLAEGLAAVRGLPLRHAIETLVHHALKGQSARPMLGRLLDEAERRLPVATESETQIALICQFLDDHRTEITVTDLAAAARDILVMTRAMTEAGETASGFPHDYAARISRAVLGYLTYGEGSIPAL